MHRPRAAPGRCPTLRGTYSQLLTSSRLTGHLSTMEHLMPLAKLLGAWEGQPGCWVLACTAQQAVWAPDCTVWWQMERSHWDGQPLTGCTQRLAEVSSCEPSFVA